MVEGPAVETQIPRRQRVGPDFVERRDHDGLVVRTAREMPEWRVSKYRPTVVHFMGSCYAVTQYLADPNGQHVYLLAPWSKDSGSLPGHEVEYDDAYVEARDRLRRAKAQSGVLAVLAVPLTPLIGFLPSGVKAKLHGRIGVHPTTATSASIMLECLIGAASLPLVLIHLTTGGTGLTTFVEDLFWLPALVLLDAVMRRNSVTSESTRPYGFYEWMFRGWGGER